MTLKFIVFVVREVYMEWETELKIMLIKVGTFIKSLFSK